MNILSLDDFKKFINIINNYHCGELIDLSNYLYLDGNIIALIGIYETK